MTISLNSLRADLFNEVFTSLNTLVTDPSNRNKQWIFSTMPDTTVSSFVGFPIIIIKTSEISKDHELFDNSHSDKSYPLIITIQSTSMQSLDSLSDSVDNVMIPSNFSQFTFGDYDEKTGSSKLNGGTVYNRTMTYQIEIGGL